MANGMGRRDSVPGRYGDCLASIRYDRSNVYIPKFDSDKPSNWRGDYNGLLQTPISYTPSLGLSSVLTPREAYLFALDEHVHTTVVSSSLDLLYHSNTA